MESPPPAPAAIDFETRPDRYKHWTLSVDPRGDTARLIMAVREDAPLRPGYSLKLNSYDLGVDIELADAIQRLRFSHPEVKVVVITSARDRIFCAGANIHMLASSGHPFKVNFCKYTNETRCAMEDASARSGIKFVAACNGTTAGGGYELALACDDIVLVDDGASAVSLPEVPLLGVLPGTGGLTRLVDKRKVRRDHADVFATVAEGVKGKRAVEWRLVDAIAPKSRFAETVAERARALAASLPDKPGPGIALDPITPDRDGDTLRWKHVTLAVDRARRSAELTVHAPPGDVAQPETIDEIREHGASWWPLLAFRELDDALLRLRFHFEEIGLVTVRTRGDAKAVLAVDRTLDRLRGEHWLVREIVLHMARVLRRFDATARSFFAIVDEQSCFAGSLLELALASDRIYMLADEGGATTLQASPLNGGALPMAHGLTRTEVRWLDAPERAADALRRAKEPLDARAADALRLATVVADEIDFADEVRVACEERCALSPDALTGMEQNLRWAGPETPDTKIFGRLSAWQNWIFTRPNATGERGALTLYGKPERPQFDTRRT